MQTLNREFCTSCGKKNLCTFKGTKGNIYTQCKTLKCNNSKAMHTESGVVDMKTGIWSDIKVTKIPYDDTQEIVFTTPEFYRGLTRETCEQVGITIGELNGREVVQYEHKNLNGTSSFKLRWPDKKFQWKPELPDTNMYCLSLCTDFTKPLIITEGNEDCASLRQLGYQACSLHSGETVLKNLKSDKEYINKFSEIWLCIENDHVGAPAKEILKRELAGKVIREIDLDTYKDANEALTSDKAFLENALRTPVELVPKGIVFGNQLDRTKYRIKPEPGFKSFVPGINESMNGYERGCLYALLAGSTTGKSTFLRHEMLNFRLEVPDCKVACLFFEESQIITPQSIIALHNGIPLGKLKRDPEILPEAEFNKSWDQLVNTDKLMFPDKDFKKDAEGLLQNIEYLVRVKKFDVIIIDHISYIIGRTTSSKQGERKDIDKLIYDLQDLTVNLNCVIIFACHVTDSSAQDSWDTGKVPSLYTGRGSRVLAQAPDGVIALSRNTNDETLCDVLNVHCQKARWDGKVGLIQKLFYISETGRLSI